MPNIRPSNLTSRIFGVLGIVLMIVGAIYVFMGTMHLVVGPDPVDLRRRWIDQQYFFRGRNPFDVMFQNTSYMQGVYPKRPWRDSHVDSAIGVVEGGGYPPWSFISGAVFVGLPWPAVRWVYALFNFVAMAVIAAWAWRASRSLGPIVAVCLAVGALATKPTQVTLDVGQYGLIVMALLVGAAWLDEENWPYLAGLLLGISLLKPNVSGPFCICFLVSRRYRVLAVAAAYMFVSSCIASLVTKTGPFDLLIQMQRSGDLYVSLMPGVVKAVIALGVKTSHAVMVVAVGGFIAGLIILYQIRDSRLLWQYAVACVIARLWSYHRPYDDLMILPLLVALGILAAQQPMRPLMFACFIAVGLSVWLPLTYKVKWPVVALQHLAWVVGMLVVVRSEYQSRPGKGIDPGLDKISAFQAAGGLA